MISTRLPLLVGVALLGLAALARPSAGGTQDFTLVNKTGVDLHNLYISESKKDAWEEDVLGDEVLSNGDSVSVTFSGKSACQWDLLVRDKDGDSASWTDVNLCEYAKIVLQCDGKRCWATGE